MTDSTPQGTNTDASAPLTLQQAASRVSGLLSPRGEKEKPRETPQPPAKPAKPTEPPTTKEVDGRVTPPGEQEDDSAEHVDTEHVDDDTRQTGEEESETAPPSQPRTFKVKVDGAELDVPEEELVKGYSRTADYTRKTTALADARRKFETEEVAAVRGERQKYAENLGKIEEALKALVPTEPDWDKLRAEAPDRFADTWAEWDRHQKNIAAIKAEREGTEKKLVADFKVQQDAYLRDQHGKLVDALPEWGEPEAFKKGAAELGGYAESVGFTPDEVNLVQDHRLVLLLRKAMLYDQGQAKKPDVQNKIDRALKTPEPKGPQAERKVSPATTAKQRLAKTGSVNDAAAAIASLLPD